MPQDTEITMTDDGMRVRVKGEALFKPGSFKINRNAIKLLDGLAGVIEKSKFLVRIEGHTDNIPLEASPQSLYKSNWELSGVRAAVVARYLVSKRIAKAQISVAGYGAISPVASNDTADGQAKNRRVEFILTRP